MKFCKTENNFFLKLHNILYLFIALNLIVLFLFEFIFKNKLIFWASSKQYDYDILYYHKIIQNLNYAVIATIILTLLLLIFRLNIKKILTKASNNKFISIIIILNIVIQFILILSIKTIPFSDSKFYIELGDRLFNSGNYLNQFGHFTNFWPVGLPTIISFFHCVTKTKTSFFTMEMFNIFVSTSTIYMLYLIFKYRLNNIQLKVFLLTWTFFPNNLFVCNIILTDSLFLLFLLFIIYFLVYGKNKVSHLIILGILVGITSYIRSVILLFPIVIFIYYCFKENKFKSIKKIVVIYFVALIIMSPWIYRNYNVFHSVVLTSTNGGFNFLMGNHSSSNGKVNFDFEYNLNNPNEVAESRIAYDKAMNDILSSPVSAILRLPEKIFFSYLRSDSSITWAFKKTTNYISPFLMAFLFYFTNLLFYLIIFVGLITYFILIRKTLLLHKLLVLIFLYFIIIIIVFVGNERYLIPIYPVHFYFFSKYFNR